LADDLAKPEEPEIPVRADEIEKATQEAPAGLLCGVPSRLTARRALRVTGTALASVLLCVVVLQGREQQSQARPPVFRTGVELIQIDVVVTDESGQSVRGLTRDDFVLLERGQPRSIDAVAEVAHERSASPVVADVPLDVASNQTAKSDRLVIVVLDDLHLKGRATEARALVQRVITDLGAGASMGLVTTSGRFGVEVTEDRAHLLMGVEQFLTTFERRPSIVGSVYTTLGAYRFVGNVAKMIGADDGRRKAFVWISAGVTNADLANSAIPGRLAAAKPATTRDRCDGNDHFCTELAGMLIKLRRAGVVVYSVSPGGPVGGNGSLAAIAAETGGFSVSDTDGSAGLQRILADLDNYYTLGFYPTDPDDRSFRLIDVQVTRPGVRVRARTGYQLDGVPPPPKNDSVLGALVAPVMPATGLPLRLHAMPVFGAGNDADVVTTLDVDPGELPAPGEAGTAVETVEYAVFAVDLRRKQVVRSVGRRVQVEWPVKDGHPTGRADFRIRTTLKLPPGSYQLRASATMAGSGRSGSVYLFTDVPAVKGQALVINGLAVSPSGTSGSVQPEPRVVESLVPEGLALPCPSRRH
jgi:VWFA-related protein